MKILYSCIWNNCKEKTWSGTTYSLYKALNNRKDYEIIDCNLQLNYLEKVIVYITSLRVVDKKIICMNISNKFKDYFLRRKLKKIYKKNKDSVIIHVGTLEDNIKNAYAYLDLSIDSLLFFRKYNNKLFKYSSYQDLSIKDLEYKRNYQLKCFNEIKGIFTMSKWVADNIIEYSNIPKEKVHWVGGGTNVDINSIRKIKRQSNKILFVGRDFFRKGGDLVYEAFKKLRNSNKNLELYIAGPKEFPINDQCEGVNFLGDVDSKKLSYYFNICDIFCMPSRFEAYGLVFVEALIYGLPCIGRKEFAMKEFIQDGVNGYLVEDDNVDELAKKMEDLLKNEKIKEYVLSKRKDYIKEYSWDEVANRMITVIENDIKKGE